MNAPYRASETDAPRLTVELPRSWTEWPTALSLPLLLDAGAEAVMVGFDASTEPLTARERLARLGFDPPPPFLVIVEGSPAVAAAAGAGVLLAERGISTAEARRILGSSGILGRIVGSPDAATAAAGADFLVVDPPVADPTAARAVVEAAWTPVLARVPLGNGGIGDRLAGLVGAGVEGLVLRLGERAEPAMIGSIVAAARAGLPQSWFQPDRPGSAEPTVLVDGVVHPLLPETAVTDLLADLGRQDARSVSIDGRPLPRRRWDDTLLEPGVEIRISEP